MNVPEITHLQFVILETLADGKKSGRVVRETLTKFKVNKSLPAFYQLMARLEEGKYVKGEYTEKVVEGQRIRERWYEITGLGERAAKKALAFYEANEARKQLGWLGGSA